MDNASAGPQSASLQTARGDGRRFGAGPGIPSTKGDRAYCSHVLPRVSRTFALCIRLLPPHIEHPVLLAYLLCRVADTIEDTADLPAADKDTLLAHFRSCLDDEGPDAGPIASHFHAPRTDEEQLASQTDIVLREFRRLPATQRAAIRPWVQEMCSGMAYFASADGAGRPTRLRTLATVEDLERYCYYVAGTVGHLLTDLFGAVHGDVTPKHYERLKPLATSFGLGLQLTNIIKDVGDDRRRGWSFVPQELCEQAGITPEDLHDPDREQQASQVMHVLIRKAQTHLRDALEYCTRLPRSEYRIRLFCLTSLYFAVRTLRLASHDGRLLDPKHKVKITRGDVYRTVGTTVLVARSNALVRAYFQLLSGSNHRPSGRTGTEAQ